MKKLLVATAFLAALVAAPAMAANLKGQGTRLQSTARCAGVQLDRLLHRRARRRRRPFRPGGHAGTLARAARQQGLRPRDLGQSRLQCAAPAAGLSLLVAVAMGEVEGEECSELYRRIRAGAGRGSAP